MRRSRLPLPLAGEGWGEGAAQMVHRGSLHPLPPERPRKHSAERAPCGASLRRPAARGSLRCSVLRARGRTHSAGSARCVQTAAASQFTKRAARAAHKTCAARRRTGAPPDTRPLLRRCRGGPRREPGQLPLPLAGEGRGEGACVEPVPALTSETGALGRGVRAAR
jgi:hypothetical protein